MRTDEDKDKRDKELERKNALKTSCKERKREEVMNEWIKKGRYVRKGFQTVWEWKGRDRGIKY